MNKAKLRTKYKEQELQKFKASFPLKEEEFSPIFDFLDTELEKHSCKGDLTLLKKYCENKNIDKEALIEWFRQHGGYCDCEILANVEEKFDYLDKPKIPEIREKNPANQKQKLNEIYTDSGFLLKKIPDPWILYCIEKSKEKIYQFQLGKKTDCTILLKTDFETKKFSDDKFLKEYWITQTDLPKNTEFDIEHCVIHSYETAIVKTKRWLPVYIFIKKAEATWSLIMKTELSRMRGDLKELEKLLMVIE